MKKHILLTLLCCFEFIAQSQINTTIHVDQHPSDMVNAYALDVDGDGDDDIISTNGFDYVPGYEFRSTRPSTASKFHIYENNGSFNFTSHELSELNTPEKLPFAFGDLNQDDRADFVRYEDGEISLCAQDNNNTFVFTQTLIDLNPLFVSEAPETGCVLGDEVLFNVERMQIGDINHDNLNDIIFISAARLSESDPITCGEDQCYALINEGSGFSSPTYLFSFTLDLVNENGQNAFFTELQVEDINNDGYNDVWYARNEGQYMDFYLHAGVSGGIDSVPHFMSDVGLHATINDTDSNGNNDIVMIDPYSNLITRCQGLNPAETEALIFSSDHQVVHGIVATDINQDGLSDFIVVHDNGDATSLFVTGYDGLGILYESITYQSDMEGEVLQFSSIETDEIDTPGVLCVTQSGIYILTTSPEGGTDCAFQIIPFLDTNLNGLPDTGESQPAITSILLEHEDFSYYMNTLSFETGLQFPEGEITVIYEDDDIFTTPLFNNTTTYVCANGDPIEILLPFEIQGNPESHITKEVIHWNVLCDDPINQAGDYIYVVNDGSADLTCDIAFTFDQHTNFISAIPEPDIINGNELHWTNLDLQIGDYQTILVYRTPYSVNDLGETANYEVEFNITSTGGNFTETTTDSEVIQCSYDPNMIIENSGHTEVGYFADEQTFHYTIFFQNTGSAPAHTVTIENAIPLDLNLSTFELVHASHPMYYTLNSNELVFIFENIQLPDSATAYDASIGYVTYRIKPISGLNHGHEIENVASIVFDFNDPIVTNTEVNTKYDCSDLENVTPFATSYCSENDEVEVSNTASWIEEVQWSYDDVEINQPSASFQCDDGGYLELNINNSLCYFSEMWQIENNGEETPMIISSGNLLSTNSIGTYQWYLNGETIPNANQAEYEINISGSYSVEVINAFGCSAISNAQDFTYLNLIEKNNSDWWVYPNPIDGAATIKNAPRGIMKISDLTGRIIHEENITSTSITLDLSRVSAGSYLISIDGDVKIIQVK